MNNFKIILIAIILLISFNSFGQITLTHAQAEKVINDIEQGKVDAYKVGLLQDNVDSYIKIISNKDSIINSDKKLIGALNIDLHELNVDKRNGDTEYVIKIAKQKKAIKILGISTASLIALVVLMII